MGEVFAGRQPAPAMHVLVSLILRLTKPDEMPQRVALCETALASVDRRAQAQLWAYLNTELGNSLVLTTQGEREENLERAIGCFRRALDGYPRRSNAKAWATVHVNLAMAFQNRIRGVRADNLEKSISGYQKALAVYAELDLRQELAVTRSHLATAYAERVRGSRAANLEKTISLYRQISRFYTRKAFQAQWGTVQDRLAVAYQNRIRGARADNLEKSIARCRLALQVRTREAGPEDWAATQHNLASAYSLRIRGRRAANIERAIAGYQEALEVYTREDFPEQWANVQANLASAYLSRIHGPRAGNLEMAIGYYQQALLVARRESPGEQWALVQNNLALSYAQRIDGIRADNLEEAISRYHQVLEVRTRETVPRDWALTQHLLANAYAERIRGARAENIEEAISRYQQALEVRTRRRFPEDWAGTQNNLASAYQNRIHGERAENLEQAISRYRQALRVYTRKAYPRDWAMTQANLASAYVERPGDERAENLERAIRYYRKVLEVFTRSAFPEQWAVAQNNLASAYQKRIRGDRARNLEQAIAHYLDVFQVRTRDAFPWQWAMAEHNLAGAYSVRLAGPREANLEQAISCYRQALKVRTRSSSPPDWASTQHQLAHAYSQRVRGRRSDNLRRAIHCYRRALEVRTPAAFPQDCRESAYRLGRLLYQAGRSAEARQALETAHQAVEVLRGEVRRDVAKRSLARQNADLYARLVSCCIAAQDSGAAFRYAAAGKGRAFVDLLATARLDLLAAGVSDPGLAADLTTMSNLRQQIDNVLAAMAGESGQVLGSPAAGPGVTSADPAWPADLLAAELRKLHERDSRQWAAMSLKYPALTATQQVPALSADQARHMAAAVAATLVEFYRHAEGWCAFVVTADAIEYVPLPLVADELLARMAAWVGRLDYPEGRNQLSLSQLADWHDAVIAPLAGLLPAGGPVVLAPFGQLHVLPLAAAVGRPGMRYLAEDYQVSFVPSLTALGAALEQASRSGQDRAQVPRRLLNVAYPGAVDSRHYLRNVLAEAANIGRQFSETTPLYEQAATPDAVLRRSRDQDIVHFGCHGWFDAESPEQSGLLLSGGWLTVQRIITELRMERARVATLGACVSGQEAVRRGDEHVGLLQAMLTSGVQAVVASLWSVDDAATRALFEAFYARLLARDSPAQALQAAARAVRSHPGHPEWQHPYYWAAFQVSGVAVDAGQGGSGETAASRAGSADPARADD